MAPEVAQCKNYNQQSDMWSAGIILYLLLSGSLPFYGKTREETLENIIKSTFNFTGNSMRKGLESIWKTISEEAKDLVIKLLQYFPEDRPSASEALQHPWITKFCNSNDPLNEKLKKGLANLQCFRTQKTLQKAVLGYIASQELTKEEEGNLKEIFFTLDANKDGKITLEDLVEGYMILNIKKEVAIKKAKKILTRTDINQNGSIDYNEFMMANLHIDKEITEERLKKAFEFIDLVVLCINYRTKMVL